MGVNPKVLRRDAALLAADGPRRAKFRLASFSVDRHGTIIDPAGVDCSAHQRSGAPFLWLHQSGDDAGWQQPDPEVVIGKVVEYLQSAEALDIVVEFDDDGAAGLASRCWGKVQRGLLKAVSIGCQPLAAEERTIGGRRVTVYTKSELWEASLVIVPSNRDALKLDRAACMRALDALEKAMEKPALCQLIGIEESADREAAEAATMAYLVKTDEPSEKRAEVVKALDEHFPEPAKPAEKSAEGGEGKEEIEAVKSALEETRAALKAARSAATGAEAAAKAAAEREAKIGAEVDAWISEGRIARSARDKYLNLHRSGKAAKIVAHLEPGTYLPEASLRDSGATVTLPEVTTLTRTVARSVVQQALTLGRSGQPEHAPAAKPSAAKSLVQQALSLGRGN